MWISDIGPGDDCRLVNVLQVQRLGGGTYEVTMNGGTSVAVPETDVIAAR
jgi:hypothetical protein